MERHVLKGTLAAALACAACVGTIGDGDGPLAAPGASADGGAGADAGLAWPLRYDGTPSTVRRLSRDELVASMQALTGDAPTRDELPAEPRADHGPLLTSGLSFIATELPVLDGALDAFTARVAPTMLAQTGCAASAQAQQACLLAWAQKFAARALRRPARDGETALYQKLLATADGTPAADADALAAVLDAIFFAPSFLYRTEIGAAPGDGSPTRALSQEEIATRLAYLATLAPPDDALAASAAAGKLSDPQERAAQLARLAQTDRGKHALAVFVLEWLGANEPKLHTKSAPYLAGLPADFEAQVRASAERAIAGALTPGSATLEGLLTTSSYASDPAIQTLTQNAGTTGDTSDTGRSGILMHPQVLAAHTKEDGVSPFRLGVFMREDLLCEPVAPPPAGAAGKALSDVPGNSLRENFEHRVNAGPECIGCHGQFAPFGYAFLPFDPVGRWMRQDPSGKPWDLTGDVTTYSGDLAFTSPADLSQKLGRDPQVRGCFAQVALEWALGRKLVKEDEGAIVALAGVVEQSGGDVLAVLSSIVASPAFTTVVAPR